MGVFVSWSGGKDCCLACYRAIGNGLDVRYLASMITEDTGRLWSHHLSPEVLSLQAQAIGIPIVQPRAKVANYDDIFRNTLLAFKKEGITGGVFGDVSIGNNLAEKHHQWIDSVCQPIGITPYLPLWNQSRESLLRDFIESGFEAIIISADNDQLGKEWLGRRVDRELLSELKLRYELSPTGEVGYYHTFVIDGPLFKKRLEILKTDKVFTSGFWFLDIVECRLKAKVSGNVVAITSQQPGTSTKGQGS